MITCQTCTAPLPDTCAYCMKDRKDWDRPERRSVYCSTAHSMAARNATRRKPNG